MKRFWLSKTGTIIIAGSLFMLIFLQHLGVLRPIEDIFTAVLKPVQVFFTKTADKTKGLALYFQSLKQLQEENKILKGNIAKLTTENISLKQKIKDSQLLEEELAFVTAYNYRLVTAKVIGRSSDEYLQLAIINQGDATGIRKGYPVISQNGILVGKVIDTNNQISKVLLLNDNQIQISAQVQNDKNSPGIVRGRYGISLNMELIPQSDEVVPGQIVTTAGLEEFIPPDLVIGTITNVTKEPGGLFQEANLTPLTDYENLRIVTVILPPHD